MGDFKSPGLIGRTFFNDGLQIRRNAWRWTYCSERLAVDLLFGTPNGGLTVRNTWRWTGRDLQMSGRHSASEAHSRTYSPHTAR